AWADVAAGWQDDLHQRCGCQCRRAERRLHLPARRLCPLCELQCKAWGWSHHRVVASPTARQHDLQQLLCAIRGRCHCR
ncbi:unnamed protein product, partial [Effrenium voratum]